MSKQRKHLPPEEKVSILRRHFLEKVPICTVCEQAGIQPSQFYQWQKQFFENGAAAFHPAEPRQAELARWCARLPGEPARAA